MPKAGGILRWPRAPRLLLVKCVGGQRAELVPALRVCPSPVAQGKVLGATLPPCPTAQCWQHGGKPWAGGSLKATGERSGAGAALRHRGRGPWSPATSGVSSGLWVPFVDIQSLRKAWVALRCARRWVMEKPALPSSWERITSTCLRRQRGSALSHAVNHGSPPTPGSALAQHPRGAITSSPKLTLNLTPPPLAYPRPVQGRDAVLCFEAATRGDDIEAVGAVTLDVQVGFGVPVLHHHDEPCPAVRQVVACHPLTALQQQMAWSGV